MTITIAKAIKNLTAGREDCGMIPEDEYTPTIDLATEGLKAIKGYRWSEDTEPLCELPGETKE